MSCSVQLKTRSTVKSKKVNNVIHRTTSETIRLGEPDVILNNTSRQVMTALAISPPPLKKSSCSFQVTGVSVTQRADVAGDDSADDLDESHTDDISRVTDNETPSFSEDTCSREADDNYIGSCSALCSVTVIPSSSQYGLAIVPSETSTIPIGNTSENSSTSKASATTDTMSDPTKNQNIVVKDEAVTTASTVPSTSAPTTSTSTATTPVRTNPRIPGTRFEIVKVESLRPFRRGRWFCMDYLDHSKYTPKNALTYKSPDSPDISCTNPPSFYTMTPTTAEVNPARISSDFGTNVGNFANQEVQQPFNPVAGQVNPYYSNIVRQSQSYSSPISVPPQLHIGQIDVMQAQSFNRQASIPDTPNSQVSTFTTQNQYFQNLPMGVAAPHSLQHPSGIHQPMTLPCQLLPGQLVPNPYAMQTSQAMYPQPPYVTQPVYISPPQITSLRGYSNLGQPGANQPVSYSEPISRAVQIMTGPVMQQTYTSPQIQGHASPAQQYISQSVTTGSDLFQAVPSVFVGQPGGSRDSPSFGKTSYCNTRKSSVEPLAEAISLLQASETHIPILSFAPSVSGYGTAPPDSAAPSCLENPHTPGPDEHDSQANYHVLSEASNNPSAIIDNKIEQAMDLVKSHLMYTVREEVEVLKVRIAELLDRINQLEMENSFLKANASPEVLNALNTRAPQESVQGNVPTTTGADGGAASK